MMEKTYEERMWSALRGEDGFADLFDAISEFKEHLNDDGLADEKLDFGWVLCREQHQLRHSTTLQHRVATLFRNIASDTSFFYHYLVQFWGVVEEEGQRRHLSTWGQPFSIGNLSKGLCWYRKVCMGHVYNVEDEHQLGGVGRAYRSKHPESTPDLRLYSVNEFPLLHEAARCNLRGYLALPLFDVHTNECYGVLELISGNAIGPYQLCTLDTQLQNAGLRSTHINFVPISQSFMPERYREQPENEITEILELAIKEVHQLHLAQVWVPCKQCANTRCMERACFINAWDKRVNLCNDVDEDMFVYLQACEFHNLQVDRNYFHQNLCDLSIADNPLAHHTKKARLFLCYAICLQSVDNGGEPYVIEFFLQPKCREYDSSLHCLLRIIEMKLRSFKLASSEQLPRELLVQSRQSIEIECESIDTLNMINHHKEIFSELGFIKYLQTSESCHLRPFSEDSEEGWVFWGTAEDELAEGDIHNRNSLYMLEAIVKEKIKHFLKKLATKLGMKYSIVQFWAPNRVEGRCYLETSDQPYALGYLVRGLASFRKKCIKHRYFVDEEAKEDELGPPGRVFRKGYPEITPDLFLYSKTEFPLRNYAVDCSLKEYIALPVFDKQNNKCVGVLELLGFSYSKFHWLIGSALEETSLFSTHIDFRPSFLGNDKPPNITNCRERALTEMNEALILTTHIPQLHMAKVLVPHEKCDGLNINVKCMELALSTKDMYFVDDVPKNKSYWIHIHPGKGIMGLLLESQSKACFCPNLCEFSIVDQPLAHIERRERLDVCFAICLQSSYTGDLLYVVEFFLNQSPQYLASFLNFLLPILTLQLKSFKYACGKQLGEELVVEVIDFSETKIKLLSELSQSDAFPIKFKSVGYSGTGLQQAEAEPVQCDSDVTQTEKSSMTDASHFSKAKRRKRKTGFQLSYDNLKPYLGKKLLRDVAKEHGVGRSTIKRACRDCGIDRWPRTEKQMNNPTICESESDILDSQQVIKQSSSRNLPRSEQNTSKESSKEEGGEKVMVKVKYKEDTIRFEMRLSSGVGEVFEEVGAGLNLKKGTFKLKYLDEDNDEILLTRDADLHLCPKSRMTTGMNCIRLLVQLISG